MTPSNFEKVRTVRTQKRLGDLCKQQDCSSVKRRGTELETEHTPHDALVSKVTLNRAGGTAPRGGDTIGY